ncbi:MAG: hypothetical protein K2L34_14800, partial [Muribaculaceae bacterium]|nr:hypothetical protein [Muribaculaceae bacterium]
MDTPASSQNHCKMGHIEEWFYSVLAGIRPLTPAYRTFAINPFFSQKLDYAGAHVDTPFGNISSRWERAKGKIRLQVEVPGGTQATIVLPAVNAVSVNGIQMDSESLPEGIVAVDADSDATHITATHGSYVIEFDDVTADIAAVTTEGGDLMITPVQPGMIRVVSDRDCMLDVAGIDGLHIATIEVSCGEKLYKINSDRDGVDRILIIGGKKIVM